ncbi:MAG: ATP-dependent Clp protease ATP-binding subunit [Deltaproteobacteria bacterium]|nr:ATP-dependent Clp protease ATP-binding subunit [Deltaproteobacteria bacterium]
MQIVLNPVSGNKRDLIDRIRSDVRLFNQYYQIIPEHLETGLVKDLEQLINRDIAGELKLLLYDPVQPSNIYLEKSYRVETTSRLQRLGSATRGDANWEERREIPSPYEFDIVIYFTDPFERLGPAQQKQRMDGFEFSWFDLSLLGDSAEIAAEENRPEQPQSVVEWETPQEQHPPVRASAMDVKISVHADKSILSSPFRAGKPLILASYSDSRKLMDEFVSVARSMRLRPFQWTYAEGLKAVTAATYAEEDTFLLHRNKKLSPFQVLGAIRNEPIKNAVYLLEDFHYYLMRESLQGSEFAEMISAIKSMPEALTRAGSFLVILAPTLDLPPEIAPIFDNFRGDLGNRSMQSLERFGIDLTKLVLENKIKPMVGREAEIQECLKVLSRMEANNPLLVGKAGVGKTAIVEGLARRIVQGDVPRSFLQKRLFTLNLNAVVSGTKYRGEFEKRIEALLEEVKANASKLIVFIDEIHTLLGMGSAEGSTGAENILKPYLARGEFPCIGATTYEEYRKYIEPDRALARRFQVVEVPEPDAQQTIKILMGIKGIYEKHHRVEIREDAVVKCVELAAKFLPNQYFPGKAVKMLDSICASALFSGSDTVTPDLVGKEFSKLVHPATVDVVPYQEQLIK